MIRECDNVRRHRAAGEKCDSKIALPAAQVHDRGSSPAVFIRKRRSVRHPRSVNRTATVCRCRILFANDDLRIQLTACDGRFLATRSGDIRDVVQFSNRKRRTGVTSG